jgi:2'-5' RNA ligase
MPSGPLRLFVSVRPDAAVAARMAALLPPGFPPAARPVPIPQIHLTLQFIGETSASRVDGVVESISAAVAGLRVQRLTPQSLRLLPERGPARLVALITDWPSPLAEARRRLAARLAHRPSKARGDLFLPHFTLARFNPAWPTTVREWPAAMEPLDVAKVELTRSILTSSGAVHQVVAAFALAEA